MKRPSEYMTMTDGVTQHDYKQALNKYIDYLEAQAKQLILSGVSQQRELLFAYHKHLDSFNDPTIYNASESMIDDYLANNCG